MSSKFEYRKDLITFLFFEIKNLLYFYRGTEIQKPTSIKPFFLKHLDNKMVYYSYNKKEFSI